MQGTNSLTEGAVINVRDASVSFCDITKGSFQCSPVFLGHLLVYFARHGASKDLQSPFSHHQ